MFETVSTPRVFAVPPGVDFGRALVSGLLDRIGGAPPEALARVEIYVNTRRMQRHLRRVFDAGPARLLPRLRLVTDLARTGSDLPPPVNPLRRKLELAQLVAGLIDADPSLAPATARFDLADSPTALMDEMHGEGVPPHVIEELDVSDQSGHWQRALSFVRLIARYFEADAPLDLEARQRQVIETLAARWAIDPPDHPVIVAGSTGSRGATALFMETVAHLPQGAVILPGFDVALPARVWDSMDSALQAEDHPQYRFRRFAETLGCRPEIIPLWAGTEPVRPARNRLVSLSLRPAPVTDHWMRDGDALGDLISATEGLGLLEAPSPRAEADAIALRMRHALDQGKTVALISPDRMLTRQVTAALDRWALVPDDSAGIPLPLTPPGRFLRQTAELFGTRLTAEALLALLKHPLTHSGHPERNLHLRRSRELELQVRGAGMPFPTRAALLDWADTTGMHDPGRHGWAAWIADLLGGLDTACAADLATLVKRHLDLAEALAAGPDTTGTGGLWDEAAGRSARETMADLAGAAEAGGILEPGDYTRLLGSVLNGAEVRTPEAGHPDLLIWGTLEARVQSADLVILGGMNEGTWPEATRPDPWFNRQMRARAGLLLPERRIGLSAHDYQQAIGAPEVLVTRAIRSVDADTVPSRWINRLTTLLDGLPAQNGPEALKAMRAEGDRWLAAAQRLAPAILADPAPRPAPCPPVAARPRTLSVTQVKTLIRDPYAIYARKILRLDRLGPLRQSADAPLRGTVIHKVLERHLVEGQAPDDPQARDHLMQIATEELDTHCPWPATRRMWLARIDRVATWFLTSEQARRSLGEPRFFEVFGRISLESCGVELRGKADRIDVAPDGSVIVYDYKTGTPPTAKEQEYFDIQLLLEAAMIERGAFDTLGARRVASAMFIGLGASPIEVAAPLDKIPADEVWRRFNEMIAGWMDPARGYTARRAHQTTRFPGDYDHLSRYGEWDETSEITGEVLE
ncbi:MAG: double-strand break repair protein AddB [Rhodobacteraceae bacterium HLUCCA08]|nr:MAG: double-strand break repair protein AddB [Rhodobacteraceae bacterium HLUCCA08]